MKPPQNRLQTLISYLGLWGRVGMPFWFFKTHIRFVGLRAILYSALISPSTSQAVDEIFELVKTSPVVITPEWVCCLHKKMMASSRVNVLDVNGNRKLNHITIGATRQLSCVNVAIQTSFQGRPLRVQFCPYDSVDAELATFCKQCTVILSCELLGPDTDLSV